MARRILSDSAKAFGKFLSDNDLGPVEASRALDVSHVTVIGWCGGTRRPGWTNRKRIHVWTGGLVKEEGWSGKQKPIERFKPKSPGEAA